LPVLAADAHAEVMPIWSSCAPADVVDAVRSLILASRAATWTGSPPPELRRVADRLS
jgi:hypothetical protein